MEVLVRSISVSVSLSSHSDYVGASQPPGTPSADSSEVRLRHQTLESRGMACRTSRYVGHGRRQGAGGAGDSNLLQKFITDSGFSFRVLCTGGGPSDLKQPRST